MKLPSGLIFSEEDKLFAAHVADNAEICERRFITKYTAFLDENQRETAKFVLSHIGFVDYLFYGGFDNASRCVLGFFPQYIEKDKKLFPITALEITYRKESKLSHRDFLGAFMSCGINRNMVGDIIVNEGKTIAFVYNTVADTLLYDLKKIGSVGVKITKTESPDIEIIENFKEINGTVSSLRCDCIVSLALKLSREKSANLIKSEKLTVNGKICNSVSRELSCGDIFSVKGSGKFILSSINGITKKDRLHINVKKYI